MAADLNFCQRCQGEADYLLDTWLVERHARDEKNCKKRDFIECWLTCFLGYFDKKMYMVIFW